jgi:hypothetical protein
METRGWYSVNWNQLGQVPVPRGFRSPKGHEASSITKVCGAFDVDGDEIVDVDELDDVDELGVFSVVA